MSVLQNVAPKTIVLTQRKHFSALSLWQNPPTMKDINDPIFMASNPAEMLKICAGMGIMQGEDIIEQGGSTNWYEVFYNYYMRIVTIDIMTSSFLTSAARQYDNTLT